MLQVHQTSNYGQKQTKRVSKGPQDFPGLSTKAPILTHEKSRIQSLIILLLQISPKDMLSTSGAIDWKNKKNKSHDNTVD